MELDLQLFGGRGAGSGGGFNEEKWMRETEAELNKLNNFIEGKSKETYLDLDSFHWERGDIKDFITYLQDARASGGLGDDDVFYVNYKGIRWVRMDSGSDFSHIRYDKKNIAGAVVSGSWGEGFFGNTKGLYAYNNADAKDYRTLGRNDYRWDLKKSTTYAGELTSNGRLQRFATDSELKTGWATFRGRRYNVQYHSYVHRNQTKTYGLLDFDVSDIITTKNTKKNWY